MSWLTTLKVIRYNAFYGCITKRNVPLTAAGISEGSRTFYAGHLDAHSVVYSAGVGKDISFELALCNRFGCGILLLDPTPTAAKTMKRTPSPSSGRLQFLPIGLAGTSGMMPFGEPNDPDEGSFIVGKPSAAPLMLPCKSIADLMNEQGHDHVDLLKMDVEGAEYDVIRHIVRHRLPIGQICVEFHHWTPGFRKQDTLRALAQLYAAGYRLIHRHMEDHTFVHRSVLPSGNGHNR